METTTLQYDMTQETIATLEQYETVMKAAGDHHHPELRQQRRGRHRPGDGLDQPHGDRVEQGGKKTLTLVVVKLPAS